MGFYDAKGYWRNEGEGFYDAKGYWVNPGCAFYDYRGYLRKPGEGFYDSKKRWVNPGEAFYDGKGYLQSWCVITASQKEDTGDGMFVIGFLLFVPIILLSSIITFVVEWTTSHFYLVFLGYTIISAIICLITTKVKKHFGRKYVFSFVGNYLCLMSFIYIALLYAVPYVVSGGSLFDFVLVLAFALGGMIVVQFFNYYHEKAILELLAGILCFLVAIILIRNSTGNIYSMDEIAQIYNLENTILLKLLVGFFL